MQIYEKKIYAKYLRTKNLQCTYTSLQNIFMWSWKATVGIHRKMALTNSLEIVAVSVVIISIIINYKLGLCTLLLCHSLLFYSLLSFLTLLSSKLVQLSSIFFFNLWCLTTLRREAFS